jgi:hypothetical protein
MVQQVVVVEQVLVVITIRKADMDILPYQKDLTSHYLEGGRGSRTADGFIDFDAIVAHNQSTTDPYTGGISKFNGLLIGSNGFRADGLIVLY